MALWHLWFLVNLSGLEEIVVGWLNNFVEFPVPRLLTLFFSHTTGLKY